MEKVIPVAFSFLLASISSLTAQSQVTRNMIYGLKDIYRNTHPKWMGFSIRCLKE